MAKIEKYSLDEELTDKDMLIGSNHRGGDTYVTASYTLGQVREYMSNNVGEFKDRWSTISYKFSGQDLYDLGDAESDVLPLEKVEGVNKFRILIPGLAGKSIVVNKIVVYNKYNSVLCDAMYNCAFAAYRYYSSTSHYTSGGFLIGSTYEPYDHIQSSDAFDNFLGTLTGSPLMLIVSNSDLITIGDEELGIWIEYKYFDFNTDF
jgi:hypothetical protein